MHAEFADQWIERHHLGGVAGRHLHGFLRSEDIELVGIEDQALVGARGDRLPEIEHGVAGAPLDIDQAGVALGAVADDALGAAGMRGRELAGEIDAHRHAFAHVGIVAVDQPLARVQLAQSLGVEQRVTVAEADLREARALAHQHREGAR